MLLKKLKKLPITYKVTVWYSSFIVILISLVSIFTVILFSKIVTNTNKEKLIEYVNTYANSPNKFEGFNNGMYFILYTAQEVPIDGYSPKGFNNNLPLINSSLRVFKSDRTFYYYDMKMKDSDGYVIRGILPIKKIRREIKTFSILLTILLPIILSIIIYGGFLISKNAFKSVKKISDTALDIKNSKDFSKRIDIEDGFDEIHEMAKVFNEMLDSLELSLIHEKQFSSDVSHELRTPISVILSESEYSIKFADNLEEAKESTEIIYRQAKRISRLVNQIMELTKLDKVTDISLDVLNLSCVTKYYLSDRINTIENINLEFDIEDDLYILGNKTMIERILDNLISNAIKFTKDYILISLKKQNDFIELIIKDNGTGISKEDKNLIFERFFQSSFSRNKEANTGSGLGLSLVSKILKLHNAKISVDTTLGKGSSFKILFKAANP